MGKYLRERQQLSRIYRWAIENFPHSTSKWLTQFPAHVVRPNGDAYSLSQCYNVTNCMAFWTRKYNNSCYHSLYSILDFDWLIHLQIMHANIDQLQITGANTLLSLKMLRQLQ